MTTLVHWLQILTGLLWLGPAYLTAPAFFRTLGGSKAPLDVMRSPSFLSSVLFAGFSLHWLLWPPALAAMADDEMSFWLALYVLSAMTAVWLMFANYLSIWRK